jgi:Holliday junction DNA helicase RuvB
MSDQRAVTAGMLEEEQATDVALRPKRLDDFVGQHAVHEQVRILVEAATRRGEPLDHILLHGPPGLGKTTLAQIIANEMGVNARLTSGPALEHQGVLASILTSLEDRDVFFIDEVHRLQRAVEEALYPAMEDLAFDFVAGKGAGAQTLRLSLNRFTVIGATTRTGSLGGPLRDRFGVTFRLDYYDVEELVSIINRSARLLTIEIDADGATLLAQRARGTPRIANRLLRRARDYAQVRAGGHIDAAVARAALDVLGIDELGLDELDRRVLAVLTGSLRGHPVGVQTIAVSVQEDPETIEDVVEPFLIRAGLIARTSRGRVATAAAYGHLGLSVPAGTMGAPDTTMQHDLFGHAQRPVGEPHR